MVLVPLQKKCPHMVHTAKRMPPNDFFNKHAGRSAPVITNDERAAGSVEAVGTRFGRTAKIRILLAACGVPDESGSPIVNALAYAFPNSRIVATDISFPKGGFLRPTNSRFARHDLTTGKVRKNRFDVVHCTNLIYHLGSGRREEALQKLIGAVKEDGLLIIDEDQVCNAEMIAREAGKRIRVEGLDTFSAAGQGRMDRRFALVPIGKQEQKVPQ